MLFSVLKGLHKAPRIAREIDQSTFDVGAVDVLISPDCWGPPHDACVKHGISIIRVTENTTSIAAGDRTEFIDVKNYREAVGAIVALREGIIDICVENP